MAKNLIYNKVALTPNKTVMYFDKIYDYYDFIEEKEKELLNSVGNANAKNTYAGSVSPSYINRQVRDIQWFGTTNINLVTKKLDEYLFSDELNRFLTSFRNDTSTFDKVDLDQKKKILFTSREIGIFSFDLASLGLVRVYEYFSYQLDRIVDSYNVRSYKNASGDLIFYHVEVVGIPRHELERKGKKYYSELLDAFIDEDKIEVVDDGTKIVHYHIGKEGIKKHDVERRQVIDKNGKKKFASTFKKSFIYIEKVDTKLPRIDLIINSAYNGQVKATTEMIWGSMAAITIAEKLAKSNVNFRVFVSYGKELNSNKKLFRFIKVKDTNEPLNINGLAVMASDPREYRFNQFKGTIVAAVDAGMGDYLMGDSISRPIRDSNQVKEAFIDYLKSQKDYDTNDAQVLTNSKIVFSPSLDRASAVQEYRNVITQISRIN